MSFQEASSSTRGNWITWFDIAALVFLYGGVIVLPLLFWPWSLDTFVGPKFRALTVITVGAAMAAVASHVLSRSWVRLRTPDWAAIAFLILTTFAFVVSVDPRTSLFGEPLQQAGLIATFALAGIYAVARLTIRSSRRLRGLFVAAAVSATIVATYGIFQIVSLDPLWDVLPNGRVFSLVGHPNWLGAYLVMTVPLTIVLGVTARQRTIKTALAGSVIVQLVVLIATLSRAAWLGLAAISVVGAVIAVVSLSRAAVWNWMRVFRVIAISTAMVVVLLLGLSRTTASISPTAVFDRAASTFDGQAFDIRQHLALWNVALAITADYPLIGTGPDTYAIIFPEYRDRILDQYFADYLSDFRPESPHNVYLGYATGAGIPALIAYAILIISTVAILIHAIRRRHRSSALLIGIIAIAAGHAVTDTFMTLDVAASWLFWCLLGGAITVVDREHREGTRGAHERSIPGVPARHLSSN